MSDELGAGTPPSEPAPTERIASLSGRRRTLVDALLRRSASADLAVGMYLEALSAIERNDSVESVHVAAYEIREFMSALPRILDVPQADFGHMKEKVNQLVEHWEASSPKSSSFKDGDWDGDIDSHAKRILDGLGTFAKWWRKNVVGRREGIKSVLRAMVRSDRPMPEVLWDARSKEWSGLLGYFQAVTHHDPRPTVEEFLERLTRLEEFLLEHLEPRTFEDQDDIDDLIADVEGSQ